MSSVVLPLHVGRGERAERRVCPSRRHRGPRRLSPRSTPMSACCRAPTPPLVVKWQPAERHTPSAYIIREYTSDSASVLPRTVRGFSFSRTWPLVDAISHNRALRLLRTTSSPINCYELMKPTPVQRWSLTVGPTWPPSWNSAPDSVSAPPITRGIPDGSLPERVSVTPLPCRDEPPHPLRWTGPA